jgi:ubiquinone/menaquinone biosynthesis C-methylase UbiE
MTTILPANGNFRVLSPEKALEFTGERMTTSVDGQIEFEHFHRYCMARDLCVGRDVLDVASGEGYGSAILAGVAGSVVGVDIDDGAVVHAREAYRLENLHYLLGSATKLPLEDASVDVVVSFETLEHIREHELFAAEVRRVLRSDGLFIVSTPDRTIYSALGEHFNAYHLRELTEDEFDAYLRAHFANVALFRQRAIFGSLVAAVGSGGPWRSYERRAPSHIEASDGLTRAPYLIGIASEADLPPLISSAYMDYHGVDEVMRGFRRAHALEALAAERDAVRTDLAEAERRAEEERLAALEIANFAEAERNEAHAQLETQQNRAAALARQAEDLQRALDETARERDANAQALAAAEAERNEARAQLETRLGDLAQVGDRARTLELTSAEIAAALARVRLENEAIRAEAATERAEYTRRHDEALQALRGKLMDAEAAQAGARALLTQGGLFGFARSIETQQRRVAKRLAASGLIDAKFYCRQVPEDFSDETVTPYAAALHYVKSGYCNGGFPNPLFDSRWYLSHYEDVRLSGMNPLLHYFLHGWREGRDPGPAFQTTDYLQSNRDVRESGMTPLVHYLVHGRYEGRRPKVI